MYTSILFVGHLKCDKFGSSESIHSSRWTLILKANAVLLFIHNFRNCCEKVHYFQLINKFISQSTTQDRRNEKKNSFDSSDP